jgi:hypothetical protein
MTMTGEQFRRLMREELESLVAMNENKGRDYAGEDDALGFFKAMAAEAGLAEEQVWAALARKHWAAILAFIRHARDDGYAPSEEVRGRILDLILYLFLLLALEREPAAGEDDVDEGSALDALPLQIAPMMLLEDGKALVEMLRAEHETPSELRRASIIRARQAIELEIERVRDLRVPDRSDG